MLYHFIQSMNDCAIQIELENCKNSCLFCHPSPFPEISKDHLDETIISIHRQAIDLRKKGFKHVELSGHDPIDFPNIISLSAWLKKIGFETITIATHGRAFAEKTFTKRIAHFIDYVRIPVYGSTAEIHDTITNAPGSFKETMEGLEHLKKTSIVIETNTLIMKPNRDDLINIIKIFEQVHAQSGRISIPYIPPHETLSGFHLSYKELQEPCVNCLTYIEKNNLPYFITDLPYCLYKRYSEHSVFSNVPRMSQTYQVPTKFKSNQEHIPSYRLKTKMPWCTQCSMNEKCHGILKTYIQHFGEESVQFDPL
jgi:MoaA/NifB/PqqE/SkfB family radical SAM enzyme